MLSWSQTQLADAAKVSRPTVVDFERGARVPHPNNLSAIRSALETAGVEFTNDDAPGVRLRRKLAESANEGGPETDGGPPEPLDSAVKG